jgi:ubiquinone/menaquinone biosynthesis C-methylase UbiE
MLRFAATRGISTYQGCAEALPFPNGTFDGVLLALALCFVADAQRSLLQCHRVLSRSGSLLLGVIPADSPWGRAYRIKGSLGHAVYSHARFRTASEILALLAGTGFELRSSASTLFWGPGETGEPTPRVESGIVPGAGFVGLLCAPIAA